MHRENSNVFPMVIDHEDRILYNEKKLDNIGHDISRIHDVKFPEVRRDIADLREVVEEQGERLASGINRLGFLILAQCIAIAWFILSR
jgi:hypothetical protein